MVKAGLKVGDIFEDDGLRYKVLSVNEDGTYISTRNFEETKAAVDTETGNQSGGGKACCQGSPEGKNT